MVTSFANRSFTFFIDNNNYDPSLILARIYQWFGTLHLHKGKLGLSLVYFNQANNILMDNHNKNDNNNSKVLDILLDVQLKLFRVKSAMGESLDALVNAKKVLEIKEIIMEDGCIELGKANQDVYEAYFVAQDNKGALPFCQKALEIYNKHFGADSVEVAKVTVDLAFIYSNLGECEKAFELNRLAVSVYNRVSPNSPDLLSAEITGTNMLIDFGRYEEAVGIMKRLVSSTDIEKEEKVTLLISLGRALCFSEKFADAKKYLRKAQRMYEKKDMHPVLIGIGFGTISLLYELMNDLDTAISLIKRALEVPELPQKPFQEHSLRFFSLVSLSGKEEEIPYMAGLVEQFKESFGPNHSHVGYGYAQLGVAYGSAGQTELAAKALRNAKDVLDVSFGPHHLTSLKISHGLSVTYAGLGRFHQALEIEEKVAEGLKGLASSERGFMHEVSKHLSKMKKRVQR